MGGRSNHGASALATLKASHYLGSDGLIQGLDARGFADTPDKSSPEAGCIVTRENDLESIVYANKVHPGSGVQAPGGAHGQRYGDVTLAGKRGSWQ